MRNTDALGSERAGADGRAPQHRPDPVTGTGPPPAGPHPTGLHPHAVWQELRTVIDPEVGIDVVSLGLIYQVETEGTTIRIEYTLTTERCPMGDVIAQGIAHAAARVPGVRRVEVDEVWDPPWHPGMIDESVRPDPEDFP